MKNGLRTKFYGWWYLAIAAGYFLLGLNRWIVGGGFWAILLRWGIAAGFALLGWGTLRSARR